MSRVSYHSAGWYYVGNLRLNNGRIHWHAFVPDLARLCNGRNLRIHFVQGAVIS